MAQRIERRLNLIDVSSVVLTLRVWAVWNQDKKVGITLLGLFILFWTIAFIFFGLSMSKFSQSGRHLGALPMSIDVQIQLAHVAILIGSFHKFCFGEDDKPYSLMAIAAVVVLLYDSSAWFLCWFLWEVVSD
jgi:hypothetical protein